MDAHEITEWQRTFLVNTYSATLPLVRGEGCFVWDASGKQYLDLTSGISVCNLGHCHPQVTAALREQAGTLVHVSNLFVNEQQPRLAKLLAEKSFGGRAFFANSGAEANEGLIKFARKWGASRGGRYEILCMSHSFHGRTLATLAATDKPKIREGFAPDMPGFRFAPFNDLAAVRAAVTDKTVAILMEPVQGEGGVRPATPVFIKGVRQLCNERDLLLLFDEVQCGMGRTGHYFAYQAYGVEPDAMSLAKALGNGFPIGAFLIQRRWEDVLVPGDHASTFGGTPLACAAAVAVLTTLAEDGVLDNCCAMAAQLREGLDGLAAKHAAVREVRGLGLLLGVELDRPVAPLLQAAAEQGVLLLSAGENVIRLLPPLTAGEEEVKRVVALLDTLLGDLN